MSHMFKRAVALALIIALIAFGIASAHADLVRSDPRANSVLDQTPAQISIWYSEPIEPGFSTITVLHSSGSTADLGDSSVAPSDPTQLTVSVDDAGDGTYLVSWRVLSAIDGHITSGSWVFSVGEPIDPSVSTSGGGAITSPFDMLARALGFVGQSLLVGVMLFRWLVWRPALASAELEDEVDERSIPRSKRIVLIALGLAMAGALLTLIVQSSLAGAGIAEWLGTRVGRVWIGRAATLAALAVLAEELSTAGLRREHSRREVFVNLAVGWLGVQLLLTTSLTSHSASIANPPLIPLLADVVHLLGTALWVGGLAQMAFVVPFVTRTLDDEDRAWLWLRTVVIFSTVAAFGIGVLLVTGVYMSMLHVGDWGLLLNTLYGRALLFKLALAGVAMLLGAYNLWVTKPQLDRAVDEPESDGAKKLQGRFKRLVAIEAIVGIAVLASAGILTALPRSRDPQPLTISEETLQLSARSDDLDINLTIDPASALSSNTFDVQLKQADQTIVDASSVSLRFTYLTRSVGTVNADMLLEEERGVYVASGAYLSLAGDWQIEIAVRRPSAFDAFAAYRVKVDLDSRITPLDEITALDSIARWLSLYGLAFGGVLAVVMGVLWMVLAIKASRNTWSQVLLSIPTIIAVPLGIISVVTFFSEVTPGLGLTNPFLPDQASLAIGQQLWETNCVVCHGETGRGDGLAIPNLNRKPPDYADGHLDIHTDGDIFFWIREGFPNIPDSPMPKFAETFSEDETWHVVNYVRRLRNLAGSDIVTNAPQPAQIPSP